MKRLVTILALLFCCAGLRAQCTPGATIRVGTSCTCNSCTSVTVMSLESYAGTGLDDEWIPFWHTESLKAGAVAYRSYGAYHIVNPYNGTYDLANTTCKQVWTPSSSSACVAAAAATAGLVLSTGVGGPIARSEYAAETNGFGCGDGFTGCATCTPSWPCTPDAVCAGKASAGHWRGMCQWGSQRWAQAGQSYTWILNHYYNPGNIYICGATAPCSPATTNDFCYGPPLPQALPVGNTCNPVNGTTCGATASIMTATSSCSNSHLNSNARDVWYSFVATGPSQTIRVHGNAAFDAVAEVYSTVCATATLIGSCINSTGMGQAETITLSSFTAGNTYYIRVYDYNENANTGLAGGSNFTICVSDPLTGSVEELTEAALRINPNPSTAQITIASPLPIINIDITDLPGKTQAVTTTRISATEWMASLATLPAGIYFVTVRTSNGLLRTKVIRQ